MKKFFSVLLSIIFGICCLFTLLLSVVRVDFNYSAITKIASELLKPVSKADVSQGGIFHPGDAKIKLAAYDNYGDFDAFDFSSIDITNLDVNELVEEYLAASGIDVEPEFIAEVLASPEVSDFVDKYVGEVVSYMTGSSEELTINPDDLKKVINKSIDMYEEHTGEVVDRTGLNDAIDENVNVMKTEITAALDNAKEENAETFDALKKVEFFLSLKFYLLCIGICAVIALIILIINKNIFSWLAYIFMPVFVDGILIFVVACCAAGVGPGLLSSAIKDAGLPAGISEGIWAYIAVVLKHLKIMGTICAVGGIAFWAIGFSLGKKKAA